MDRQRVYEVNVTGTQVRSPENFCSAFVEFMLVQISLLPV